MRGSNSHGTGPWSAVASATTLQKLEETFLISFGDTNYTQDPAGRTWQSFRLRQTAGTDSPKLEYTGILLVNTDGDDTGGIRFSATSDISTNIGFQAADVVLESFFDENPFDWFTPSEGAQREVPAFNQNGRYWDYTLGGFDPTDEVTVQMVIRRPGSGRPIDLVLNPGEADEEKLLDNADSAVTRYVTHTITGAESYTFRLTSRTNNNWVGTLNAMSVTVTAQAPEVDAYTAWAAANNITGGLTDETNGVPTLIRYALGGDADTTIGALQPQLQSSVDQDGLTLSLTFHRIADPLVNYAVWFSEDLEDWGILPVWQATGAHENGPSAFTVEVPVPTPGNRGFLRLEVTRD